MKTAIILDTALITTTDNNPASDQRINQYVSGFSRIAELVQKYDQQFDLYWVDNTITNTQTLDQRLLVAINKLPNLRAKVVFFDNKYGATNKGSGVVAAWRKILPEIEKNGYEFVIYFEPRQQLKHFTFFETFLKAPGSYFKTVRRHPTTSLIDKYLRPLFPPYATAEVWTGLFSCPPQLLFDYVQNLDLEQLFSQNFNLEGHLYQYLKRKHVIFKAISDLGLSWHDTLRNRYVKI